MSRKVARKIGTVLVILGTLMSPITLKQFFQGYGGTKEVITAQGIIDNKRSIDYECGTSKNRQTCSDYILSINGTEHFISSETFYNYTEGQHITLVRSDNVRSAYWYETLLLWYTIISISISAPFLFVYVFSFLFWCFVSDTKLSFKDWMNY